MPKRTLTPGQRKTGQIITVVVGLSIMVRMCIGFQDQNDAALGGRDDDRASTATTDAPTTTAELVDGDEDDGDAHATASDASSYVDPTSGYGFELDPAWTPIQPEVGTQPVEWCVDAPRPPCSSVFVSTANGSSSGAERIADAVEAEAASLVQSYARVDRAVQAHADGVQVVLTFDSVDPSDTPVRRLWVARIGHEAGLVASLSAHPAAFTALESRVRPFLLTLGPV